MQAALAPLLNTGHPLCKNALEWNEVYALFSDLLLSGYEENFIRLMASLVILENLYELTPEQTLILWEENPYWQLFSGFQTFQHSSPATAEHYAAFRRIAGKQRLAALEGMTPLFGGPSEAGQETPEKKIFSPVLPAANSADIRRALLPKDPSLVSMESEARKIVARNEPYFDTVKPCLVDTDRGKQLVLQVDPMGQGPFTYQWFRWTQSERVQEIVPNAQLATLVMRVDPKPHYVAYRCLVKNSHCPDGRASRWFFIRPKSQAVDLM